MAGSAKSGSGSPKSGSPKSGSPKSGPGKHGKSGHGYDKPMTGHGYDKPNQDAMKEEYGEFKDMMAGVNQQNMVNVNFAPINNNNQNFVNVNTQWGMDVGINMARTNSMKITMSTMKTIKTLTGAVTK